MTTRTMLAAALAAVVSAAGCNQATPPGTPVASPVPQAATSDFRLASEPAGARGVSEVRKAGGKDGDEVVVIGRIGGSAKPFVAGRAAFTIVDPALKPCSDREGDTCETPWDYCCDTPEDLAAATVLVKVVDKEGKTVARDAKELLGVKELQTVVVRGRAKRDEKGNLTAVQASGLFVRP